MITGKFPKNLLESVATIRSHWAELRNLRRVQTRWGGVDGTPEILRTSAAIVLSGIRLHTPTTYGINAAAGSNPQTDGRLEREGQQDV